MLELIKKSPRTNKMRHIKWHETCNCKCRSDSSVCNNKHQNDDKCRCECKELIDECVCGKGSIWNPGNYKCEFDKSCDVSEYLDYENCKCIKKLVDKLIEESIENINELKMLKWLYLSMEMSLYVLTHFLLY